MDMFTYQLNEGSLSLPRHWLDQSMNIFAFPDETGGNLVINRTAIPLGVENEEYYQQILEQFRHNLKGYQENDYQRLTLADNPAHLLDYQWQSPEGKMYQLSLLYIHQQQLLTFTYTLSEPFSPSRKASLLNILHTFQPQ